MVPRATRWNWVRGPEQCRLPKARRAWMVNDGGFREGSVGIQIDPRQVIARSKQLQWGGMTQTRHASRLRAFLLPSRVAQIWTRPGSCRGIL